MAWTKLKTAIVVGVIAIAVAGTATVTLERIQTGTASASLKFAGYATPEAALESMIWTAGAGGPMEKLADGITPDQLEQFKSRMAGKSADEVKKDCIAWANSMAGYKITQKEVISDDEVHLHIHATPSVDALHSGHAVLIMKRLGSTWRFAGDAS